MKTCTNPVSSKPTEVKSMLFSIFSVLRKRTSLPVTCLNKDLAIFAGNHAGAADMFFANVGPDRHLPIHRADRPNVFEDKRGGG